MQRRAVARRDENRVFDAQKLENPGRHHFFFPSLRKIYSPEYLTPLPL
jgi:hypothetical protein